MNAETFTRKAATVALGVVLAICLGGAVLLASEEKPVPEVLVAVGGVSAGSLATAVTGRNPSDS